MYDLSCDYVDYERSNDVRDVLFGMGDWYDETGCHGVKRQLSRLVFYERWLPNTAYTPPTGRYYTLGEEYYDDDALQQYGYCLATRYDSE